MDNIQASQTTLSKIERLKIANQFRILEKISEGDEAQQYAVRAEVFERGYTYLYDEVLEHFWEEMPQAVAQEVIDILQLNRAITFSVQDLPETERADLPERAKFEGFDGNNESEHFSFATFLCEEMSRFNELQIVNSHCPTLDRYRAQLKKWADLGKKQRLTKEQIEALLAAQRYWE